MRSLHVWTFEVKPGRMSEFRELVSEVWPFISGLGAEESRIYENELTLEWISGERRELDGRFVTVVTIYRDAGTDDIFTAAGSNPQFQQWEDRLFRDPDAPARSVYFAALEESIH